MSKISQPVQMNHEEYWDVRCCMCPNEGLPVMICPGIVGTPHPDPSPCTFVKIYTDSRGWKYKVMPGLGGNTYKGRYQDDKHTGSSGWKCMRQLKWQNSFDEAQSDLNKLAEKNGWKSVALK